jgi:hypothetical protein
MTCPTLHRRFTTHVCAQSYNPADKNQPTLCTHQPAILTRVLKPPPATSPRLTTRARPHNLVPGERGALRLPSGWWASPIVTALSIKNLIPVKGLANELCLPCW